MYFYLAILETSFFYKHNYKCNSVQNFERVFIYHGMLSPNAQLFWTHFAVWWRERNNIEISLSEAQTLYGITDTVPQCLGLNLCLIIAKYYIYTASKNEEDYFFDAFLSILKNKIQIETSKAKVQVKL